MILILGCYYRKRPRDFGKADHLLENMKTFYSVAPAIAIDTDEPQKIKVRALVFYEGEHTDGGGKTLTYSAEKIQELTANSNEKIGQGIRVQLFKDHDYESDSVIGTVLNFEAREISPTDLPHEGMTDLIGKWGIFAEVEISGAENITRYKDNRIKSVSSGIDLQDEWIYEVSVVPFPALAGASLFQSSKYSGLQNRLTKFADTINSFDLAETEGDTRKDSGILEAIEDFAADLRDLFGVNLRQASTNQKGGKSPMANEKGKELNSQNSAPPSDDVAVYKNEIAQLKQQLEAAAREKEVAAKFHELRKQGESLRDAGKLTPAAFSELFDNEGEAIAKYSEEVEPVSLPAIQFHLDMLEKFGGQLVEFGRGTETEPEEKAPDSEEMTATAKRIAARVLTYGGRK